MQSMPFSLQSSRRRFPWPHPRRAAEEFRQRRQTCRQRASRPAAISQRPALSPDVLTSACLLRQATVAGRCVCTGCSERTSLEICLMCSGVVPQQPPITRTPACRKRRDILRHVLRRAEIDIAAFDGCRQPGIGHRAQRLGGERKHLLDRFENALSDRPSSSRRSHRPAIRRGCA